MTKGTSVRNTTWDELQVGAMASLERTCSIQDLYRCPCVGHLNPLMLPDEGAPGSEPVAPGPCG